MTECSLDVRQPLCEISQFFIISKFIMINRTIKNKWLSALRSGDYRLKLNGPMKTNYKRKTKKSAYTALGVLCAITGNENNRDMLMDYPRIGTDGAPNEFVGLSSSTQVSILKAAKTAKSASEVIRYISRNISTSPTN
jgi:hypothetical protein